MMLMTTHSQSSAPPLVPSPQPSLRILVAEDPLVRNFLRTILQRHGYQVVTGDPEDSGGDVRAGRIGAQLIITNRPECFLAVAHSLPMLYIAATPDAGMAHQFVNCRVLRKPFRNTDLLEAVEDLSHDVLP